ncbi:cytochrome c biogenesis CcdA family protein [Luteitalea sp.]|uniref:cytochrome c biogenesis CcdA family protein n=1 Tax=Luteitalea sp. TaxID=2004800 RepID=UPI0025C3FF83|nr:cytochrome c biogenesis CcdA family protein [Luteitalea sp.]
MSLIALSLFAGVLAALSPCVLPLLPIVVGSAVRGHRAGPLALAAGLVVSFTVVGMAVIGAGAAIGLEDATVRRASAVLLIAIGVVLVSGSLHVMAGRALAPIAERAARLSTRAGDGLGGQFLIGALLGGVWSPCVGPTLGAAFGLASQGTSMAQASLMMVAFGVGSSAPLLATAYTSRVVRERRQQLVRVGQTGHTLLGAGLLVMGLLVWFGLDKVIEAALLDRLPQWWVDLLARV